MFSNRMSFISTPQKLAAFILLVLGEMDDHRVPLDESKKISGNFR